MRRETRQIPVGADSRKQTTGTTLRKETYFLRLERRRSRQMISSARRILCGTISGRDTA
jgi:hypothetical protein